MGTHAEASDDFDFDGCLALARGLWAFAEQLVTTDAARRTAGTTVMHTWKGVYATQAATSLETASTTARNGESGLRDEARTLASTWADEFLRECNIRYKKAADAAESHKSWLDKVGDWVMGDSTYGDHPAPTRPPVPSPPAFAPTRTLPDYDFG